MATNSTGNCYLCGASLAKSAMKNHILKLHGDAKGEQECCLLKIEGVLYREYWLYIRACSRNPKLPENREELGDLYCFLRHFQRNSTTYRLIIQQKL